MVVSVSSKICSNWLLNKWGLQVTRTCFFPFLRFKHKNQQPTSTPNAFLKILTKGLTPATVKIHFIANSPAWLSEVVTDQIYVLPTGQDFPNQENHEYVNYFQC